ncbi:MAG: mannose-1-phosphate guanylyltransferase/mannose-6-phosphate isomerase [Pseudomonadota bacterium]
MSVQPVILCGGAGSRLWPLSRTRLPKQLLSFGGDQSLLQATVERVRRFAEDNSPTIICNDEYRFLVADHIQSLGLPGQTIMLEPMGRNTAPAIAMAAFHSLETDPNLLVLPSDHLLQDVDAFGGAIAKAAELSAQGRLVTFGIKPDAPNTGYGYVKGGEAFDDLGFVVEQFVEKPDLTTAEAYLKSGDYYWNSGMFVFRASVYLRALEAHAPEIYATCEKAAANLAEDLDFVRIDADIFNACPSESIDYAVMEKTDLAAMVPLDAGWSDIGSYESLWENLERDSEGNVLQGDVMPYETSSSFVFAESRLVATVGVKDLTIVETSDAVLVANKSRSQEVKQIVQDLAKRGRTEHDEHQRVYRPWGFYESVSEGDRFQVKHIQVKPGAALSLQKHHHRAEHWVVVSGTARVTKGDEVFEISEDQSTYIPIGEVHRLENPGKIPLSLIEVQSGSYLGEDDIVRFDDQYGRSDETTAQ